MNAPTAAQAGMPDPPSPPDTPADQDVDSRRPRTTEAGAPESGTGGDDSQSDPAGGDEFEPL